MTRTECLQRAQRAELAAKQARERCALLTVVFGGSCELAQDADAENLRAVRDAREWRTLAAVHHQTRARIIRSGSLPLSMFGY